MGSAACDCQAFGEIRLTPILIVPTLPARERELTAPAVNERRASKERLPRWSAHRYTQMLKDRHFAWMPTNQPGADLDARRDEAHHSRSSIG